MAADRPLVTHRPEADPLDDQSIDSHQQRYVSLPRPAPIKKEFISFSPSFSPTSPSAHWFSSGLIGFVNKYKKIYIYKKRRKRKKFYRPWSSHTQTTLDLISLKIDDSVIYSWFWSSWTQFSNLRNWRRSVMIELMYNASISIWWDFYRVTLELSETRLQDVDSLNSISPIAINSHQQISFGSRVTSFNLARFNLRKTDPLLCRNNLSGSLGFSIDILLFDDIS